MSCFLPQLQDVPVPYSGHVAKSKPRSSKRYSSQNFYIFSHLFHFVYSMAHFVYSSANNGHSKGIV